MVAAADTFREVELARRASVPARLVGALTLVGAAALCAFGADAPARARAVVISFAFSAIEASQYARTGRGFFTSVDQFFANVVYVSVFLDRWQRLESVSPVARVAAGPLTIWVLEIVQNYALLLSFGRNSAWCYTGCPRARCHGAVDLAMGHLWWGLCFALEVAFPTAISALGASLGCLDGLLIVLLAATYAAGASVPRYPPRAPRGQLLARGVALVDWRTQGVPHIVEVVAPSGLRPTFDFGAAPGLKWVRQ